MMLSYKSDYPNQVHQMNVSISKHYHVLKDGRIKYQDKKFDINWKNYSKTNKNHLVTFLIRDHFSNCFYAELHRIDSMPSIKEFLYSSWRKKERYEFCGIPKTLIVNQMILKTCPEIQLLPERIQSFHLQMADNGFATGIRSVRDWEDCIRYNLCFDNYKKLSDFQEHNEFMCRHYNLRESGKTEPNLKKWATNISKVRVINDYDKFNNLFN